MLAPGFFTAGLLNGTKVYVLAVIEHGTRPREIQSWQSGSLPTRWF
jgi:hypothetical protein